ncbi:MAG: DpnII family type II restriction endonuclease [Candidatus Poribacteria bacterium]|nr:DpnII family type II restriction endonuclease [Candidatus Poribacteria bacterium]
MGSRANSLGHLVQNYVAEYLKECFSGLGVSIQSNGTIPGVSHNDINSNRPTTFDIVVSKQGRFVAVEISFQVTTNSLIERKAGQAQARYNQINSAGHRIAYVLDGAGNFQRKNALGTICSFSHCNVAFSDSELEILRDFILEHVS